MSRFVLDASVALSWVLDDELDRGAAAALERTRQDGAVVPELWHHEVRNALLVAERRGRIPREGVSERLDALRELPLLTDRSADLESALELAIAHDLSFYDALYLELAIRLGVALATLDQALATAVRGSGLETLSS